MTSSICIYNTVQGYSIPVLTSHHRWSEHVFHCPWRILPWHSQSMEPSTAEGQHQMQWHSPQWCTSLHLHRKLTAVKQTWTSLALQSFCHLTKFVEHPVQWNYCKMVDNVISTGHEGFRGCPGQFKDVNKLHFYR